MREEKTKIFWGNRKFVITKEVIGYERRNVFNVENEAIKEGEVTGNKVEQITYNQIK